MDGADTLLKVPVGTFARVVETGEEYEISKEDEQIAFRGGKGGLGNARFKSSTNQNPSSRRWAKREGWGSELTLTFADAGLIGLPNAGNHRF